MLNHQNKLKYPQLLFYFKRNSNYKCKNTVRCESNFILKFREIILKHANKQFNIIISNDKVKALLAVFSEYTAKNDA